MRPFACVREHANSSGFAAGGQHGCMDGIGRFVQKPASRHSRHSRQAESRHLQSRPLTLARKRSRAALVTPCPAAESLDLSISAASSLMVGCCMKAFPGRLGMPSRSLSLAWITPGAAAEGGRSCLGAGHARRHSGRLEDAGQVVGGSKRYVIWAGMASSGSKFSVAWEGQLTPDMVAPIHSQHEDEVTRSHALTA